MKHWNYFIIGLKSYVKAAEYIVKNKVYWYALFPAVLMLGIYKFGDFLLQHRFEVELKTLNDIIWYQVLLLLELSIAILFMQFSKYLVVTILSPLLSYISVKTEFTLTGNKYPFNRQEFIWQIRRGIILVVRNIFWQYSIFLLIFLICSFFWDDVEASPLFYLTYLVGFYYYGFSFLDYINERKKMSIYSSISLMKKYAAMTFSIGMIYSLLILLPVNLGALFDWSTFSIDPIGKIEEFIAHLILWVCASFAPILATIASTICMHDVFDLKKETIDFD